ncbi:bifunctional DNA primase/polymerase [Streptomyces sp. NPDC127066]|uniref:bifunctional DNA primase/polymerase n=1 Tax=Streptomyces sp. NPDC127066 TaxID=3347125 RepID=UPI003648770A
MTQNPQVSAPAPKELPTRRRNTTGDTAVGRLPGDVTEHQRAVALTWLARGVSVVPCSRTDKGALVPGFGRDAPPEQLSKFSDPQQVQAWWSGRFKRAHVGLLTGRGADGRGLVVVDLDMPKSDAQPLEGRWSGCHGGTDVLELLAREAGADWPDTYAVLTPSGGMHLYFEQPSDGPLIGCATGEGPTAPHIGPLVDVRGVGGYVIAAGSYSTAQGRVYERVSTPEMRPQPLPDWLLELLRPSAPPAVPPRPPAPVCLYAPGGRPASRAERYAAAALDGAADDIAQAVEGERNRRLFSSARRLGELHSTAPTVLDETTVREQLLAAALRSGQSEREAVRTIRSGWERGLAGRGAGAA